MRGAAASIALVALVSCVRPGVVAAWGPPEEVDIGVILIDRTAENEIAANIEAMWERLGLSDGFGGVYEYDIIAYKPIFFMGAARGSLSDQQVMDEALGMFGGEQGPLEPPSQISEGGQSYLCAPFNTSGVLGTETGGQSTMAAMSAVCVWSDEASTGFGLGVAGRNVEEVLKWTAASRRSIGD